MTLGQRVAVMKDGRLQQVAPPLEVYRRPANVFVGGFVGSPAMNFLPCEAERENGGWRLDCGPFDIHLADEVGGELVRTIDALKPQPGNSLLLGVRPQDIELVSAGEGDVRAKVDVVEPLGSEILLHLDLEGRKDGEEFRAIVPPETSPRVDDAVGIRFRRDRLHLFDIDSEARLN